MNCLWLVWFMPPKPDTVPVKALTLPGESAISSPPLPIAWKAMLAVPPDSTSTTPLPITTAPPPTTASLAISMRLPGPLAMSVPELLSAPSTKIVPLLKVSNSVPALIVAPLSVSAPALKTIAVMPALKSPPVAPKDTPEPSSSVAPEKSCMFAPMLPVPRNSKVPPLLMNSGLPLPSLVTALPDSMMARAPAEIVPPNAVPPPRITRVIPLPT